MSYFYLFMAMVFSAAITVGSRCYNQKNQGVDGADGLYRLLVPCAGTLMWLVLWLQEPSFDLGVLPYSLLYSLCYLSFTVGMLGAVKTGSTSLTGLVKQAALVGVSLWGFVFWDTRFTLAAGFGIGLLILSLGFCLITREQRSETYDIRKWLLFAALVAVGNAGCSIVQRYQQMAFQYQHKNMFMLFSVIFALVWALLLSVKENKKNWGVAAKAGWPFAVLAGCSGAASNIFILLLVKHQLSPVILYPGVAVGGLMLTTLITFFGFREKLRPLQWFGLAVGAVSLVLLNL